MTPPSRGLLDLSPVVPVVTIFDPAQAVPVARALLSGGIPIIELTLRTQHALQGLSAIAAEVPDILLGAGSVLTPKQADLAVDHGARFLVSPGASPGLLQHLVEIGLPVLPGVATVSEMLTALDHGLTELKFFPAGPAGGPAYLAAVASPVPQLRFCPTGGVTLENLGDYLALPNVAAVGGSWITPAKALAEQDWRRVSMLARDARRLAEASRRKTSTID